MANSKRQIHASITVDRIVEAVQANDSLGFCLACGADAYGVEPDARNYACEECGQRRVYGAEECLMMTVA